MNSNDILHHFLVYATEDNVKVLLAVYHDHLLFYTKVTHAYPNGIQTNLYMGLNYDFIHQRYIPGTDGNPSLGVGFSITFERFSDLVDWLKKGLVSCWDFMPELTDQEHEELRNKFDKHKEMMRMHADLHLTLEDKIARNNPFFKK